METWKPVKGYEGLYEVSNLGKVKGLRANKVLHGMPRMHGYLAVWLYKDGQPRKQESIHRLVAEAFCENPYGKPEVNHINENKTDNRASNLEWVTRKENVNLGTVQKRRAETTKNNSRSTPVNQYTMQGEFLKTYPSIGEVNRQTGFAQGNIHKAMNGEYKHAYGFIWRYANNGK